jgi:hypothetical protein
MLFPIDKHFLSAINRSIAVSRMGIDIGAPAGTPTVAPAAGRVYFAGPARPLGDRLISRLKINAAWAGVCLVKLDQAITIDGRGYGFVWFGNLGQLEFTVGLADEKIEIDQGQRIGRVGSDGGLSFLNFGLLTDNGGAIGEPLPKQRLYSFIWQEVAESWESLISAS